MKTLPRVDVAIAGGGWSGLLMAKELGARTGLSSNMWKEWMSSITPSACA